MHFHVDSLPRKGMYAAYYDRYIELVRNDDVAALLQDQMNDARRLFVAFPDEIALFRYAEGKWSVKEVLQHVVDTERVMVYRALTFSRENGAALPGFEQDVWAKSSYADTRPVTHIVDEFYSMRNAMLLLFESFTLEQWHTSGTADGKALATNAIPYIIAGHYAHHRNILMERYSITG